MPIPTIAAAVAAVGAVLEEDNQQNAVLAMILQQESLPRYRLPLQVPEKEFILEQLTDIECKEFFRFSRQEIQQILPYLALDNISYRHRYTATPELAFCLLLSRLSSNKRFKDDLLSVQKLDQELVYALNPVQELA
jgi:hypothetical protein